DNLLDEFFATKGIFLGFRLAPATGTAALTAAEAATATAMFTTALWLWLWLFTTTAGCRSASFCRFIDISHSILLVAG
ncbi:MAG: hypothetical protein JF609_00925, partial [Verrucomicrobia bacterium]|nr:hypothetical protein [Verrucomicrobiota bacterium]